MPVLNIFRATFSLSRLRGPGHIRECPGGALHTFSPWRKYGCRQACRTNDTNVRKIGARIPRFRSASLGMTREKQEIATSASPPRNDQRKPLIHNQFECAVDTGIIAQCGQFKFHIPACVINVFIKILPNTGNQRLTGFADTAANDHRFRI